MSIHDELQAIIEVIEKYSVVLAEALKSPLNGLLLMLLKHTFKVPQGTSDELKSAIEDSNEIMDKLKPIEDEIVDVVAELEAKQEAKKK
jgi:hypothetical protein